MQYLLCYNASWVGRGRCFVRNEKNTICLHLKGIVTRFGYSFWLLILVTLFGYSFWLLILVIHFGYSYWLAYCMASPPSLSLFLFSFFLFHSFSLSLHISLSLFKSLHPSNLFSILCVQNFSSLLSHSPPNNGPRPRLVVTNTKP